ncbi:ABC transporter ATP-binding protein [Bacillus weihaiensis]|uniref:ABC transporter ATP-binding protein n=1 Tax=Bacillus weihaiensis TaxID=1547283 RepID=UPI002353BFAC|nr:ABC transporter ATP-binding protein [Bacillus weihaiensis]
MLQLKQIYKVFNEGSVDEKIALNSLNLSLAEGDFVTVIGSNGAGKSTLLNVIAGRITPDVGDVMIKEKQMVDVPEYKRSRYIGRVFQDPMAGTAPTLSIEENLAIAYSRVNKRSLKPGVTSSRRVYFKEQLEMLGLGLENRLSAKVGLLSGGERQALSLLMATFTKPDILLLDEHTAALDPSRAELITNLTKKLVEKSQLTTLMITHNMQQAVDLGNRLIMMDKGIIVFEAEGNVKKGLTVSSLLDEFSKIKSDSSLSDKALLI